MTGYGRGEAEIEGARAVVEIRSVNHRFLDLKLRGSNMGLELEEKLRSRVKSALSRGSVTVTVKSESASGARDVRIDGDVARQGFRALRDLADSLGLERPVDLSLLVTLPGVVVLSEGTEDDELASKAAMAALDLALEALVNMRAREGEILHRDLSDRLARIGTLAGTLAEASVVAPERAQKKLAERIERLLASSKVDVDSDRIAVEVAVVADRLDVTEELVRVRAHLEQFSKLMSDENTSETKSENKGKKANENQSDKNQSDKNQSDKNQSDKNQTDKGKSAIGRRLDFLTQELGREFNTVASKSQSADISSTVVEAKAELEKLREQVQNIE